MIALRVGKRVSFLHHIVYITELASSNVCKCKYSHIIIIKGYGLARKNMTILNIIQMQGTDF